MMISHQYPQDELDVDMEEIEVIETNGVATTSLSSGSFSSSSLPSLRPSRNECADEAKQVFLALLSQETTMHSIITPQTKMICTPITTSCQGSTSTLHNNPPINNSDRTKMCSWYYEMSTFLKISPGTASRAMSYLDRFMGTESPHAATASRLRDEYQLVALTTLFIAIKLYERLNIMPCHVSYLSRGRYTSEEVIAMEMAVLKGLKWKVTSATKLDYADLILDCIRPELSVKSDAALIGIRELMSLQIQLSDFHSLYSTKKQSMVALAAVMNAYEVKKSKFVEHDREVFLSTFRDLMTYYDREDVYNIMDKLCCLVDPSSERRISTEFKQSDENKGPSPKDSATLDTSCKDTSLETFDAAFETMEDMNFDTIMSHFLCCGSIPVSNSDSAMESNAAQMKPKLVSSNSSPGIIGNSNSFNTQGSIKLKTPKGEGTKQSPVSIATMLFGMGS